jgi:hypothetical protein
MSIETKPAPRFGPPWILIALSAVVLALLIIHGQQVGRFDPTHRQNGANWPGDLAAAMWRGALWLGLLVLLLRPWSYRRSWGRALVASLFFGSAGVLLLMAGMHAGPTMNAPTFWMLLVALSCLIAAGASAWAGLRQQRAA